jgi:hypothetical protein
MQITGQIIVYIVLSCVPALVAFGVLAAVSRIRTSHLWLVPGWLACAALAPLLATFFAIRTVIAAFSALATSGGGIGSVSAGIWEALQPSLFAGYVAGALVLITVIIALRGVINAESSDSAPTPKAPAIVAVFVLLFTIFAVAFATQLLNNLNSTIIDVIDPRTSGNYAVATTSSLIASRLTLTAGVSVGSVVILIIGIIVLAVVDPKTEPGKRLSLFFVFASVLSLVGLGAHLISLLSWASRLYQSALTGQIVR